MISGTHYNTVYKYFSRQYNTCNDRIANYAMKIGDPKGVKSLFKKTFVARLS